MQELRSSVRGTLHGPQRYLEGDLETFGGGCRNSVRSGRGEHVSNEFDGLTHHIGEPRSKTRMFKRLNGSSQRCQVFRCQVFQCHSCQVPIPNDIDQRFSAAMCSTAASIRGLLCPPWPHCRLFHHGGTIASIERLSSAYLEDIRNYRTGCCEGQT